MVVSDAVIDKVIVHEEYMRPADHLLALALTLQNGHVVIATVPNTQDQARDLRVVREIARAEVATLETYLQRQRDYELHNASMAALKALKELKGGA